VREFIFVDDARVFGGGQRNVLRLARFVNESLPERSARVICPGASELAKRCRAAGIPLADACFPGFGALAPVRITHAVGRLRRIFAGLGADTVVVGMSLRTQVYAHAAALGSRRRLRIVHFLPEQDSAGRLTARLLLRRYGSVVVVGDIAARTYQELLPDVHVHGMNNFLLEEEFQAAAAREQPVREGLPVVGVLTRLLEGKGVVELLSELAETPDAWSRLLVTGGRQDEQYALAVERRISDLGLQDRVRLLGQVDELGAFFDEIDTLVVPSVGNEGQPTVILEALAHGRPVIVREPMWSHAFDGLPVVSYRDALDLRVALTRLPPARVSPTDLARRFGPNSAIEAIEAAAEAH
jgi:glycosyltransferase involved in cell wall biosynthesis